jgi:hypothetical protein
LDIREKGEYKKKEEAEKEKENEEMQFTWHYTVQTLSPCT